MLDATAPKSHFAAVARPAAGSSEQPALVLLHGLTSSPDVWTPVLPALQRDRHVVNLGLAGHRGGPLLSIQDGGSALEFIVDCVATTIDDLELETPTIVGNSLGGWVALELARRGRAGQVIAFSPAGAWRSWRDAVRLATMFRVLASPTTRRSAHRMIRSRPGRAAVLRPLCESAEQLTHADALAVLQDLESCTAINLLVRQTGAGLASMHPLPCPIHVVWSARDRVLPFSRYGRPMIERLPGVRFSILEAAGHVPMYDRPDEVARLILQG